MALQGIGQSISFKDIKDEFGLPTDNRFGNYRITEQLKDDCDDVFKTFPLDDGIPQNGQIKFSDFYSKKLNLVVDVFSESTTEEEINVYKRYTDEPNKVIVVGGKGNKNKIGGSRIRVVVNQKVGSGIGNSTKCALRTDSSWPTDTDIIIYVEGKGKIAGAGGNGGRGADGLSNNAAAGSPGGSAIGVEKDGTQIFLAGGGIITQGFGGGGGGGAGRETSKRDRRAGGGGGGGGAGIPAGTGGRGGARQQGRADNSPTDETRGFPTALLLENGGSGYNQAFPQNRSTTIISGVPGGSGLTVNFRIDPCSGTTGGISGLEISNAGTNQYFKDVRCRINKIAGESGADAIFRITNTTGTGVSDTGERGDDGTENTGGAGGKGGDNQDQAFGGAGGIGGDAEFDATDGANSTTESFDKVAENKALRGVAGRNGAAIRRTSNSINFSFTNNGGTIRGEKDYDTGVFQST